MSERSLVVWLVLLVVGALLGYGYYLLLSGGRGSVYDGERELDQLLEYYGLTPTGPQLDLLRSEGRFRQRLGAWLAGTAVAVMFVASFALPGHTGPRIAGAAMMMAWLAGTAVGHAWAVVRRPRQRAVTGATVRFPVAGALSRTELVLEVGVAAAGWAALLVGIRSLAGDGGRLSTEAAVAVSASGVLAAVTATAALLMQWLLARVPVPADDDDDATVTRLLGGASVRELTMATFTTVAIAMVLLVFVSGTPWPLGLGYVAVIVLVLVGGREWRKRAMARCRLGW
ncbi:MAG: hypothetical protein WAK18_14680 [Nocardioidaceae bacterium]